jgi:hypothetical protein
LWLIPRTTKFPREQRFVLARAVQETALSLHETLIEAAMVDKGARPAALAAADVELTKLRFYVRLCKDLELIQMNQYQHVAEMLAEIGRLLGGWQKSLARRG